MIRARKRFGQHFLEPVWVEKLVRAIDPQPDQTFIEIGPGRAALTRPLAGRAKQVVAFEIDRDLARELRDAAIPNVTVVEGDFLEKFPSSQSANPQSAIPQSAIPQSAIHNPGAIRVAGNLPYNVASPIMFSLVEAYLGGLPLVDATLMLQLEVAERLVARPGTKEYGVLSVLIRHCADVDLLLKLPPGAFRPPPKVRSAVVRMRFHPPDPPVRDRKVFERLVQAVFTRRRKTLANALRAVPGTVPGTGPGSVPGTVPGSVPGTVPGSVPGTGPGMVPGTVPGTIDLNRRPETLTVAEFAALADVFSSP